MIDSLLALLYDLIGPYNPPQYINTLMEWNPAIEDWEYYNFDVIPSGAAGVDWPWICCVALFGLTLYCIFRLIGGLLK